MPSSPKILSRYLAWSYLGHFLGLLFVLLAIVYMLDTIELLRRAVKRDDVPVLLVLQMGLFKLPEVGQIILPFAILFSAMYTFWALSRRYELAVIRAAGLSVWQFLMPVLAVAFTCGLLSAMVVNPLGAMFISKFEQYETRYLGTQRNLVSVFEDGFWIRQPSGTAESDVILNADRVILQDWTFQRVMGLAFDAEGSLVSRLDAERARLGDGEWVFENVHITNRLRENYYRDEYRLPTEMTRQDIEDSFASPETIPFWFIPEYIDILDKTGFDSTRLKIHFHHLLSMPVIFTAMIFLAAAVALRPPRSGRTILLIAAGVAIGILFFFLSSYVQALGASQQIPPVLAAWAPAVIAFLLGLTALLSLEDG